VGQSETEIARSIIVPGKIDSRLWNQIQDTRIIFGRPVDELSIAAASQDDCYLMLKSNVLGG
ncbi:hypothetical protein TNCV_4943421, partial [Trichonephila clavipes]